MGVPRLESLRQVGLPQNRRLDPPVGLIGIQSHHPREKMSKKAREKPAEAGSASVSPYGSVLSYELVTSQPNRLINLIWPECRTWFIGP